jgi:ABC-type dipeptide/oligopeptide/nickel transport system permease subunit
MSAVPTTIVARRGAHRLSAGSWVAVAVLVAAVGTALLGPLLSPHSATALVGVPYSGPTGAAPLGTDAIGRDVLSRLLHGGRSVVLYAGTATLLAYLVGGTLGLLAGYSRSLVDPIVMRIVDVMLAFPPLIVLLLLAAGIGRGTLVLIVGVAAINVPMIARVVRTVTLEVGVRGYVEAAVLRGERTPYILARELLPNIAAPIAADAGVRFTASILAIAALNFLGLGIQPPTADWSTMIAENRDGITLQPWALAAPALLIAALAISVNTTADALARSVGRNRGGAA